MVQITIVNVYMVYPMEYTERVVTETAITIKGGVLWEQEQQ